MRFIAAKGSFITVLLLFGPAEAQQTKNARPTPYTYMSDPIFGVDYSVKSVRFEEAPASLARLCHGRLPWKRMWIFAYFKAIDGDYYIVAGWTSDGYTDPLTDGLTIEIHGVDCSFDQPGWILSAKVNPYVSRPIAAAPEVVSGLVTDLLRRYTAAFGGKAKFLRAVHQTRNFSPSNLPDPVRIEFDKFAKSP
ncbi:MAG TPA: hypothetical protein VGG72_35320 [Bryobacteraceae bacterium]|jgi:hypothetical protein